MAFDAGTIVAHLDLDDSDFDRKLREDVAKIEAFEKGDHEVKITTRVDESGMSRARGEFEKLDRQVTQDSRRRGGVLSALGGMFGSGGGSRGILGGLAGAAGPGMNTGILSRLISTRTALIAGGAGVGLGALPALAGGLLGPGVGLAGGLVGMLGARMLIGTRQKPGELYQPAQQAMKSLTTAFQSAAQPLAATLRHVFGQIPSIMKSIAPQLRSMFAGAATDIEPLIRGLRDLAVQVLPLLGKAFRAAAPLIQPFLGWLGQGLAGILRGLIPLIRAAAPAVAAVGHVLAQIGSGLGGMLRAFAPAIRSSAIILKALGDVIGAVLRDLGPLAATMARQIGPIFAVLAQTLERLLPFLRPIGDVLAKLAGAVLRDLVSLLRPLADLLVRIAPSFDILAKALGQTFTVMENTGVFGVLANALERIVPPLARLINDLVRQLAPYLPVVIAAFAAFLDILVRLTALGLTAVINALDWLIRRVPFLVPILAGVFLAFKAWSMISGWIDTIAAAVVKMGVAEEETSIKTIISAAKSAAAWVVSTATIVASFIAQAAAATAAFIAENAATLGIIAGIALLVGAIIFLATHWKRVWSDIKNWAHDAWEFLTHGWGQFLIPGLTLIRWTIELVRDHWKQAWDDITGAAQAAWHFIYRYIVGPMINVFTNDVPDAFHTATSLIGRAWGAIQGAVRAPVAWVVDHVIDGLISAFDWVSGKVGGPHIAAVHPFGLASGGRIPGYGGGDRHLALLEGGEAVVSKETTSRHADTLAAWGVPGFQLGGFFRGVGHAASSAWHGITGAASKAGGLIGGGGKIIAALATGNTVALTNAIKGMFPGGVGGAIGDLAQLLLAIPKKLLTTAIHFLIGKAKAAFGSPYTGHYGAGVAQWRGDVLRALAMEGLPLSLASRVLYQMQTESGGNPNAQNNWDSNAAAGDPSRGLLQTIMSTFRAYHWPGTSFNIFDPLANIAAAINYARSRYGPALMSGGMGMGSGHGYDDGGWMLGGLNQTGRPEAVLNPGQSAAFLNLAEAAHRLSRGGGTAQMMRDIHLMLPEGTTIAEALREIGWALRTTRQQAYTGVTGG